MAQNKLIFELHLYLQFSDLVLGQEETLKIDQRVQTFYSLCMHERKTEKLMQNHMGQAWMFESSTMYVSIIYAV